MTSVAKSRSWTFPASPCPADAVALVSVAGCHPSFPASAALTFLCAAGDEAASPGEGDSGAGGEDAAHGEEEEAAAQGEEVAAAAVLVLRYIVSLGLCRLSQARWSVPEVQC